MVITAETIVELLARRHSEDVFVPECKDGPTWYGGHLRMDAWAMKRSWATPITWGYEIKTSRSDFLSDDKWPAYLDLCSDFYFVVPSGLVSVDEVGEQAGLLTVAKTGTRLWTKKRAPHRDIEPPEAMLRYVLMSRALISDYREFWPRIPAWWRAWLGAKEQAADFGHRVSKRIREVVGEQIHKVESENRALAARLEGYAALERFLTRLGIDPTHTTSHTYYTEQNIKARLSGVDPVIKRCAEQLGREVRALERAIAKIEAKDGHEENRTQTHT